MKSGAVVFDRYRLEEWIGAGGMGVVWRATDLLLDQPVALKRVSLAGVDAKQAELTRARTLREARAAARLRSHRHVVATYDVRIDDGDVWLVLEYVPSRSLSQLRRERGPLELAEIARIGARVADALAAGHAQGIVHRDVTPGNVLIAEDGTVKLTDFGISHLTGQDPITQDGAISGTIAFLAPEVAASGASTPASDVFSLGSTLYAAIEGLPPFGTDDNAFRLLNVVRLGVIRPPASAGELTPLLLRLLALDPATRPDAVTARDLLDQFATQTTVAARPPPPRESPASGATTIVAPRDQGPGPSSARPARWPLRRRILTGALALITVAILGAGTVLGIRSLSSDDPPPPGEDTPLVGAPAMPATVGPISLTGDPKAADPCALIDLAWLHQFGLPRITTPYNPNGCRAQITTANSGDVNLYIDFNTPAFSVESVGGQRQQLGALTISRKGIVPGTYEPSCQNVLLLADRTTVWINVYGGKDVDQCAVAEVGTATAVTALDRDGITYRPGRTSGWQVTNSDACTLLTNIELVSVSGLNPTIRSPGFANWWCSWGTTSATVELYFRLDDAILDNHGDPTVIAGRRAWLRIVAQGNPHLCEAIVVSRPAASPTSATEIVKVQVRGPQKDQELCARASDLAAAAVARLPGT